ncbi:High mobility group protein B1 [Microtus ochrogaster]|uniref:High mobility group protein B1 n=1 Tax=Microtus ochrogaster TaxID=79684 RepID=A0A8J6KYQ0_MICOH|nr:High mobility group protein B1 [Microtus ochrogaster]
MGKGDPKKPRGKTSLYAFFVQTCREEHKKKHPDASVNFSEFSKKCSERWKTMSAKEKETGRDVEEHTAADDKQPDEKKAAKLKEKYEKDTAAYRAKGKPDAAKKGVVKAEKSKKKKEEEDDEEDEEDEEEEEEEEDEDEEEDDDDE